MTDNIRYELDAPMRKVRAELGLDPLEPEPAEIVDDRIEPPAGIIETDRQLTPEEIEEIRKEWRDRMSGPGNSHKPIIFPRAKFTGSTGPR